MGKGQVCPSCSEMLRAILATLQGTISRPRGQLPSKSTCPLGQFSFYSAFKILLKKKKILFKSQFLQETFPDHPHLLSLLTWCLSQHMGAGIHSHVQFWTYVYTLNI